MRGKQHRRNTISEDNRDYEVGRGKPPVHTRFKKGQSGNPRGPRPKNLPALLVDALGVERSLAHNPLFQVFLVLQNAPVGELRLPGLTFSPVSRPGTTAKFDLGLELIETAGGFEYTDSECCAWMREAGFCDIRVERLDRIRSAVIGIK